MTLLILTESSAEGPQIESPDKIILPGLLREELFNSPLGVTKLRWVRSVEDSLGKNPLRATVEASRASSRALRLSSVPTVLQNWTPEWNIVFMDEVPKEAGLPSTLVDQCHPGWMIPPASIYIVASRLSNACSSIRLNQSDIESRLSQVVVHEIAHAIEHKMLGALQGFDRARAEGFASWFELLAARGSPLLDELTLRTEKINAAKAHFNKYPVRFVFDGSMPAYSRMAMYFLWIEKRYGLSEIFRVYSDIKDNPKLLFTETVSRRYFSGNEERLQNEVLKYIESGVSSGS
ncbi:MAG TPA: hypothetical protein PKA63_12460 [Oligoflexia bacterium]|nr:hypothetical protein [Oligoflexia bacterium]HMP49469.1 hypothetical protein [Oligoflexia bacterium]